MSAAAGPPAAPTARGRRARRVSGDEREREILATAERLLGERPLQAISVDDLASGAGISRPTFYFYFASKEAVLLALMDRLVEQARSGVALADLAGDPESVLREGLRAIHETFAEHRAVTLAGIAARATSPAARELWERVMEGFVQESAAAIEAERTRGAAPPGPPARDLAVALNLMNERVLAASLQEEGPSLSPAVLLDTLVEVWLRSIYGADGPPARR